MRMARWSSGQDAGLSRLKQGFDSPTGHQKDIKRKLDYILVGVYYNDGPPVPISNTVVKFICADNT